MIWVFICVHVCVKLSSAADGWVGYSFISQEAVFPPWIFMTFGLFQCLISIVNNCGFSQLPEKGCSLLTQEGLYCQPAQGTKAKGAGECRLGQASEPKASVSPGPMRRAAQPAHSAGFERMRGMGLGELQSTPPSLSLFLALHSLLVQTWPKCCKEEASGFPGRIGT